MILSDTLNETWSKHVCDYLEILLLLILLFVFLWLFHLTFSIVLKSTPVKIFPRKGTAQGPGGKLEGLQFLTTSFKSNNTKPNKSQPVKSIQSNIAWKNMMKRWSKKQLWLIVQTRYLSEERQETGKTDQHRNAMLCNTGGLLGAVRWKTRLELELFPCMSNGAAC